VVDFFQQLISGIAAGSLYALMAIAVVLIYKSTDIVNFAQAEMAMVCGYVSYSMLSRLHFGYELTIPFVILIGGLMGIVADRLLFRPLLKKMVPPLSFVIATLGLNMALSNSTLLIWGPEPQRLPEMFSLEPIRLAGVVISMEHAAIIAITSLLLVLMAVFFRTTKIGLAMRAAAEDKTVATLMGVNVPNAFCLTWAISSAMGGLVGIMFANVIFLEIDYMGPVLVKAFVAAVLGGLQSITGAVIGGFLLGVIENMAGAYVSVEFKELLPLIIVLVVLLIKPTGLFSKGVSKKA
jgi:branched-chain amino acid transport system permease protein